MLSVASSLFGKSSTLGAYTLHSADPSPSSSYANLHGVASGRSSPAPKRTSSFNVGLWKVVGATHKTTNKDVSVWVFEKRVLDGVRNGRDWVIEQLKKEVRQARADGRVQRSALMEGDCAVALAAPRHFAHGRAAGGDTSRAHVRHRDSVGVAGEPPRSG